MATGDHNSEEMGLGLRNLVPQHEEPGQVLVKGQGAKPPEAQGLHNLETVSDRSE